MCAGGWGAGGGTEAADVASCSPKRRRGMWVKTLNVRMSSPTRANLAEQTSPGQLRRAVPDGQKCRVPTCRMSLRRRFANPRESSAKNSSQTCSRAAGVAGGMRVRDASEGAQTSLGGPEGWDCVFGSCVMMAACRPAGGMASQACSDGRDRNAARWPARSASAFRAPARSTRVQLGGRRGCVSRAPRRAGGCISARVARARCWLAAAYIAT